MYFSKLNPKSLKFKKTYISLPKKIAPNMDKKSPSKTSSSLNAVKRIFFHNKKIAQKKPKTKKTPNVYIFIKPKFRSTGNIVFSIIYS